MKPTLIIAQPSSQREKQRSSEGFTLIELLVVVIIIGTLSAAALPSILGQVGKAREAEAKQNLSAIGQAQQAYFFTKGKFSDLMSKLDVAVNGNYYTYPDPTAADSSKVKHQANDLDAANHGTRNYSLGVYHDSTGQFSLILCQSESVGGLATAPNISTDPCSDGVSVQ